MINTLIWDFDGTLFNTYPNTIGILMKIIEENGKKASYEELDRLAKVSIGKTLQYCRDTYGLIDRDIEEFTRRELGSKPQVSKPYEGAFELCRDIKAAGGQNFIYTHRGTEALGYLDYYGFSEFFTEVVTCENGFASKPSPEAVEYLLNKYSLDRSRTMMVGDRIIDIMSGKNAGTAACYFDSDGRAEEMPADYTVTSLNELRNVLFGNGRQN